MCMDVEGTPGRLQPSDPSPSPVSNSKPQTFRGPQKRCPSPPSTTKKKPEDYRSCSGQERLMDLLEDSSLEEEVLRPEGRPCVGVKHVNTSV